MRPTPDPRTRARATTLLAAAAAAVAARGVFRVCRSRPPGGSARWTRTNHRGEQVSLLLGPAAVAAAAATTAVAPGLDRGERLAGMVAVLGSGAVGLYDDLAGTTTVKGFRGHLRALRRGEVTSGLVKIAGIGASGVLAAAALREGSRAQRTDGARSASDRPHSSTPWPTALSSPWPPTSSTCSTCARAAP